MIDVGDYSLGEERLLAELKNERLTLPYYKETKEYYKHGWSRFEEWLIPMREDASLESKLLNETNVIPNEELRKRLVFNFYKRKDKWASAVAFVKANAGLINNIRDQVAKQILGDKCPNRQTLLER